MPGDFQTFTNATKIVVLKPSGHAVSGGAWTKVVKDEGTYDGHRVKGVIRPEGEAGSRERDAGGVQDGFMLGAGNGLADGRAEPAPRQVRASFQLTRTRVRYLLFGDAPDVIANTVTFEATRRGLTFGFQSLRLARGPILTLPASPPAVA